MTKIALSLTKFPRDDAKKAVFDADKRTAAMEFHIRREVREKQGLDSALFALTGNVVLADVRAARDLAVRLNRGVNPKTQPERVMKAGQLNAMGLIDEILHYVVALYREQVAPGVFGQAWAKLEERLGDGRVADMLQQFGNIFPPQAVYAGQTSVEAYLKSTEGGESCRSLALEELMLLAMANLNPAFRPFLFMFGDKDLSRETVYPAAMKELQAFFASMPVFGPDGQSLWDLLRAPALAAPDSLTKQLEYMRKHWGLLIGKFMARLLTSLDIIKEEEKPSFFGPGPMEAYTYGYLENEYEKFSPDQDWMPRTVLMAKSTLVWLYQLSKKYGREITRLDQIPDEELDELARRGFTGLWLIGLWERSNASKTIKQWTGNPEAAASAYSLYDYDIAGELGGWGALANLRERAARRGIRLGSDMVPNHTGIDSRWMIEHPDRFLQLPYSPFPGYTFNCGNLSGRDDITVQIEEHYFTRTDAAVVFRRIDNRTGDTRFIYHGNDGTSMPWNDTAQIDFLNAEAREAVIQTIIGVCKQFPIVRFDAAMTLAKRHIQRLWYPEPGHGGDIASRSEHAISAEEFNRRIPNEFWREVVDRCAVEAPGTLLLAEAFWMMEGYFVRTLGMHRVYNSAFMNMLKMEDNAKYRATIKNTIEFDPEILKRFVNFMNNPDEETAVAQFGKGDKYFGIATLLVTMPGLPMFGHGQIEGFTEKYGMEYRRAYKDEQSDQWLVDRHEREIFPLMKKRYLFSGSADFRLFDFWNNGSVNENVFAYTNRAGDECALILYNNSYSQASGWIKDAAVANKESGKRDSLCEALGLHGEGDRFVLMRELKSSLWYIRSSKDVAERGLFAALNGYEAQAFLDVHEVQDDEYGSWARLHHDLQGRGVPNIENAKLDLALGELYWRFNELFKPGISPQDLKPIMLQFIATARAFIMGAGTYKPWAIPLTEADQPSLVVQCEDELVWECFCKRLERMRNFTEPFIAFSYGYAVLSMLRCAIGDNTAGAAALSLVLHWQLDRKMKETLLRLGNEKPALGIKPENVWHAVEIMKAALGRAPGICDEPFNLAESKKTAKAAAHSFIMDNYLADDFRSMLGVNVFDDVTWFNKECFERLLEYAPVYAKMETDDFAGIDKIAAEFEKAETKSGFKLTELIGLLGAGPAKKTVVVKKKSAAKTTGVKTNVKTAKPKK